MYFTLIYVLLLRLTMKWQDWLETFITMVREWHHLKVLKCAGQAFDPAGIAAIAPGFLEVLCHVCPLSNINLLKGWNNVPPAWAYVFSSGHLFFYLLFHSWLYTLIIAIDANFQLKSRLWYSINKELTLSLGWSYFVDNGPYFDFIKDYVDEDEVRISEIWCRATSFTCCRFRHVLVSRHFLTCLPRSWKVFVQQVWLQLAVLITNFFSHWV